MAIKLTIDQVVRSFRPKSGTTFSVEELNGEVGGWVEPFKVGPVWVMYCERAQQKNMSLNELASYFFEVPLYGDVIVVPSQQLPASWDLMEESEQYISSDMVDSGFLLSLQNALMLKKMRDENPGLDMGFHEFFTMNNVIRPKEEYTYTPPTMEDIDDNTTDFLKQSYEFISRSPAQFKKGVLLEDQHIIIRATNQDCRKVLQLMKDMFLETEEYEKCAVIQKIEENC